MPTNRFQIEFGHKIANPHVQCDAAIEDLAWCALWRAAGVYTPELAAMHNRAVTLLRKHGWMETEIDG